MQIHGLMKTSDDQSFFERDFQIILESHIPHLLSLESTFTQVIDERISFKYEGDFFGLMNEMGILSRYHFIMMRVNNLRCPGDYKRTNNVITILDFQEIDLLNSIYQARNVAT